MHCKVLLHYIFDYIYDNGFGVFAWKNMCCYSSYTQSQVYQLNTQLSTMPVLLASFHKNCIIISVAVIVL